MDAVDAAIWRARTSHSRRLKQKTMAGSISFSRQVTTSRSTSAARRSIPLDSSAEGSSDASSTADAAFRLARGAGSALTAFCQAASRKSPCSSCTRYRPLPPLGQA